MAQLMQVLSFTRLESHSMSARNLTFTICNDFEVDNVESYHWAFMSGQRKEDIGIGALNKSQSHSCFANVSLKFIERCFKRIFH